MPRTLAGMICVLLIPQPVISQDKVVAEPRFESEPAKNAVAKCRDRLRVLDIKLNEQIELAHEEMEKDLQRALKTAVDNKDISEVIRISLFLESNMQLAKEPPKPSRPVSDLSVRKRIKELELELAKTKLIDPMVGKWDYHNGNIVEFTSDGWLMLNGNPIGIWRHHSNGTYTVAFLNSFASGTSDQLTTQPGRQA